MMAGYIRDDIDFSAYEYETEARAKVRRASQYRDELIDAFDEHGSRGPSMFSTKLKHCIEFRPKEVTAWAGYNGHRKSTLAGQVALDLCVQKQRVLIASFEMAPASTLARMARQALVVAKPAVASLDAFMRWTDNRLWIFDHSGRVTPDRMLSVCNYFAQELKGQQIFIDSMMMVCASEESMDEQKQLVTDLVRVAKETGLHIHLIAHCRKPQQGEDKPPTKYDVRGTAAISDQVDNVVTVWMNKPKRERLEKDPNDGEALAQPDALVSIEKQRNAAWEGKVKFWFDQQSMRFCDDRLSAVQPYVLRGAE
jgi:twinkle protein